MILKIKETKINDENDDNNNHIIFITIVDDNDCSISVRRKFDKL